jgi:hypothetical protein
MKQEVAVNQEGFIRRIQQALGGLAQGRSIHKADAGWELRVAETS